MRCIKDIVGRFDASNKITRFLTFAQKAEFTRDSKISIFYILQVVLKSLWTEMATCGFEILWFYRSSWIWNQNHNHKKYILFICHSFQIGLVGILVWVNWRQRKIHIIWELMAVHKTAWIGQRDRLFSLISKPNFWACWFEDYQVVQPDLKKFKLPWKQKFIALWENQRDHGEYERAIMAIPFSDEMVGTQFHPEVQIQSLF